MSVPVSNVIKYSVRILVMFALLSVFPMAAAGEEGKLPFLSGAHSELCEFSRSDRGKLRSSCVGSSEFSFEVMNGGVKATLMLSPSLGPTEVFLKEVSSNEV